MEISKFDISDYLDNNEMIAEYLNEVLKEGDNTQIIAKLLLLLDILKKQFKKELTVELH